MLMICLENDYERDKYRVENDVDNAPENAARWTGGKACPM